MAGFKMHVSTSSVLGCAYAAAGYAHGLPPDTALVAGAMCGFSGMLPDLDSDYGVPLRETMCFTAATVPMLLLDRFASFRLRHDEMVLLGVGVYLFMRFGITNMIRKYTVHRGMFHSFPACLIFAGLAFLICGTSDLPVRYFKSGGVIVGFMSHLMLDEIYAVEWKAGRWRLKKSFGTAMKFWGDDAWANFSTYAKLLVVGAMILAEPSVMAQIRARNPEFARQYQELQNQYRGWTGELANGTAADTLPAEESRVWNSFAPPNTPTPPRPTAGTNDPYAWPPTQVPMNNNQDTAQRLNWPITQ